MNLEQSDSFKEQVERADRSKKGVVFGLVLCGVMIALLVAIIMILKYQDSITEKLYLDGKQIPLSSTFYKADKDGNIYINVKQAAETLGYEYRNGKYGSYDDEEGSCYFSNDYVTVALDGNSNSFKKVLTYAPTQARGEYSEYTFANEVDYTETLLMDGGKTVQVIDNEFYIPLEHFVDVFDAKLRWEKNRYNMFSFKYCVDSYTKTVGGFKYHLLSGDYENLRALLYGYAVVGSGDEPTSSTLYAIYNLTTNDLIVEAKYSKIVFSQSTKKFYAYSQDRKIGLIDPNDKVVVVPKDYDTMNLLDREKELYIVSQGDKYGVINSKGKPIVYCEYDEIGLNNIEKFPLDQKLINNPQLLLGKAIPVKMDGSYGLINLEGENLINVIFDEFGCIVPGSSSASAPKSVMLIPPECGVLGLVVNKNELFGIYDLATESWIFPQVLSKIYAVSKSGTTTYYVEYNNKEYNLAEFIEANGVATVDKDGKLLTEAKDDEDIDDEEDEDVDVDEKTTNQSEEKTTTTSSEENE